MDAVSAERARIEANILKRRKSRGGSVVSNTPHGGVKKGIKSVLSFFKTGTFVRPLAVSFTVNIAVALVGLNTINQFLVPILKESNTGIDPYVASSFLTSYRHVTIQQGLVTKTAFHIFSRVQFPILNY